jgi:PKD repeat protein
LCGGEVDITLVNASSNTAVTTATNNYEWRFTPDDAVNGSAQTFTGAGSYSLQNAGAITPVTYSLEFFAETVWNLGAADEESCSDVINPTTQVVVYPELIPVYATPDPECSGQTGVSLTFVKQGSSSGGDVNDVTLEWSFGDGNTQSSTFQNVSHTFLNLSNAPFTTPTHIIATQIATGCTYEDDIDVTVYPRVTAAQSFTLGDLCGGEVDITLVNASSNTAVTTATNNYEWRFTPDDAVNGSAQTFTGAGSYSLQNAGAITPVTYSLEFFAETVWNLGAADEESCSDVINPTTQVVVYPELIPVYATPDPECSGQTGVSLTFVKQGSSSGGDVNDVTLEWSFGDGNTQSSTFQNVSHTFLNLSNAPFTTPTHIIATQIATGCTYEDDIDVTVYPRVTAAQSFTLGDLCGGTVELTLSNGSSNLGVTHADATNSYQWVFTPNDLTSGVAQTMNTNGTYSLVNNGAITPVVYTLQFTAQTAWADGNTCDHTITGQSVSVYPNLNPIYDIPAAVCSGLSGATLDFIKNAASSGGDVNDVSIQWDFSDGNTRTTTFDPTVSKLFTNISDADFTTRTKIFAMQLATGCTAYREIDVLVHPKVESIFSFEKGDECQYPLPVTFSNASKFAAANPGVTTTFHWDYDYEWAGTWQEDTRTSSASHTYSFYNAQPNAKVDYDITLAIQQYHSVSDLTCSHNSTRTITVYPELIATFDLPVIEGCNPLTVSFDDNSTGVLVAEGGGYQWTFGDGTGSSNVNPVDKIYGHTNRNQSVNYPIGLTITNPLGCQKSHSGSIEVYPLVVSSFNVAQVEGCTPLDVTVNNTSTSNAYVYQWNFENGLPANATSAQPGTVQFINTLAPPDVLALQKPKLHLQIALNQTVYPVGNGCAETHEVEVTVYPHVYPSFDADLQDCHPLEVDFDNTTHIFGGTSNGSYRWNFGNGVQSNFENYSQTYLNTSLTSNRTFDGKLYAVSEHGCTDSIDFQVVVFPKPQSRMELADYMDCSPFDMEIQNLSVGKNKGSTLRFEYNFGDGADSTTYSPDIMNHMFRNTSNSIQPYMISLYVETEDGCSDFSSQTIQVYPEVTAHFNFRDNIDENCNPFNVQFDNNSVNAWYYEWDFNDGANSYLFEPVYRFVNNTVNDRVYDVELTAISEFDCEDTYTLPLTVFAAPIADFAVYPPLQVFPENRFEFRNQSRPANMPANWIHRWEFGDGYTSDSQNSTLQHEYETWGPRDNEFKYTTVLTIDNGKCWDSDTVLVTLQPPVPVSVFKADKYQSCSPLIVNFTNEAEYYYTSQDRIAFEWRVNDEVFSNEAEPSYTFVEPGYYNVSLSVFGDGGEKHFYQTFRVFENPVANFEALPEKVTLPNAKVHFFNLTEKGDRFHWYFGDGDYSTDKDPVHIYNEIGEYRVSLTAYATYDYNGEVYECIDISSKFPAVWVEGIGRIRFPNAFVPRKLGPNGGYYDAVDYKNEVFHPVAEGVVEYKLIIFNRWGEQIFQSDDIKIGWDGYYKGKLANQDVYVWRAIGRFSNGQMFDERGNVTLLR